MPENTTKRALRKKTGAHKQYKNTKPSAREQKPPVRGQKNADARRRAKNTRHPQVPPKSAPIPQLNMHKPQTQGAEKDFKSGFVSIVGMPNVGKSTLLNTIAGQKLAITSDKPQTTRNRILAVHTTKSEQIIFTDTPGIHRPRTKLGEVMVSNANSAIADTDVVLFMVDATRPIQDMEREIAANIGRSGAVCILVINKIDLVKKENLLPMIANYSSIHSFEEIVPLSAQTGDRVELLIGKIKDYLPQGPKYYYDDTVTDISERQIAAEIIREKLLWLLDEEVPHGIAVEIERMQKKQKLTAVSAVIYCEKNSHKGIIIGKNGETLKKTGALARADIEKLLGTKVFLELWVRVKSDWRNNAHLIKNFGYLTEE